MPKITIKKRWSNAVLFEADADDIREALYQAIKARVDLRAADLRGARLVGLHLPEACLPQVDFRGADLARAAFSRADLHGANFNGARLHEADFENAALAGASFARAELHAARLRGTDLGKSDFEGAELVKADFTGAILPWQSHDVLAELLRRAARRDVAKLKVAGLVLVSRDRCWGDFVALDDPLKEWALGTLAAYVRPGDGAPEELRRYAEGRAALGTT